MSHENLTSYYHQGVSLSLSARVVMLELGCLHQILLPAIGEFLVPGKLE